MWFYEGVERTEMGDGREPPILAAKYKRLGSWKVGHSDRLT